MCPIFKSGRREERGNYRPISILCILSKILERHVHIALYDFIMKFKLLHLAQSGFRTLHSCETALAYMTTKWAENMNKGDLSGIVLLDLRKAFDMVDHELLLRKLALYRVSDSALQWFKTYLKN